MVGDYPSQPEAIWALTFNQITLRDDRGVWEEAQWNKRHLSVDESLVTPLAEETTKADNWNGAPSREWIPRHLS